MSLIGVVRSDFFSKTFRLSLGGTVPMATITLTMTAPKSLSTRMESSVVSMISRVHLWLNVESAGMGTTAILLLLPCCEFVQSLVLKDPFNSASYV